MRKNTIVAISIALVAIITLFIFTFSNNNDDVDIMEQKREKHRKFLAESPFNDTKNLSKDERKKLGLPPNAYNERLWELTMNPDLGYPTPFLVDPIDVDLLQQKASPGSVTSPWVERGPLNVGGRTRVVFFDPNDVGANNGDGVDYNRVFAGGVGGGLWVNDDITSVESFWQIIPGLAANLSVSAYAIDPNDSNTIYIGTGEQYTDGAAVGNGLYKSTDGGTSWQLVDIPFEGGGDLGNQQSSLFKAGIFFINDIIARNVNGTTELYVGVGAALYYSPNFTTNNPLNLLGSQSAGIYRSVDNGNSWNRINSILLTFSSDGTRFPVVPNDFEVGADNRLYMGSIDSPGLNAGGGRIYSSTNGTSWALETVIPSGNRIEIAASKTDPNKFFVLANQGGQAAIFSTNDAFDSTNILPEPNDVDNGIPASDFTRGQAFYDLVIEVNPNNDDELFVGGINIHRSKNNGETWQQMSKWSNNPNMNNLNVPFVHADIHAITFKPDGSNGAVIGSDGGVSLTPNFSANVASIGDRILGYNVTQFYYGDIDQNVSEMGENFVGGTQDNGSPIFANSTAGPILTATFDPLGGDGSFSAIDDDGAYAILGYTSRTHVYFEYPITASSGSYFISNDDDGDFINVAELDSDFDLFYANSRTANGGNSITACELGDTSATCIELTSNMLVNTRATAMKASRFVSESPTLFVGTQDSQLLRIQNANSNTTKVITNISSNEFLGSVSDIEFGSSEQEIYVTFHNYGINNIWFTNDGGSTWSQKDGNLPDIPVKAILQNPLIPNEVIIGTQLGVYSTTDFDSDSPTWIVSMNGMTNVPVYDLDLRTADNTVLATTHGRGMFTGKFTAETASVDDVVLKNNIIVYPTDAVNEIFISSDQNYSNTTISVYNLNGQKVLSKTGAIGTSAQQMNVSSLSSGLYLIKIKGDGVNQTTKFLKQ